MSSTEEGSFRYEAIWASQWGSNMKTILTNYEIKSLALSEIEAVCTNWQIILLPVDFDLDFWTSNNAGALVPLWNTSHLSVINVTSLSLLPLSLKLQQQRRSAIGSFMNCLNWNLKVSCSDANGNNLETAVNTSGTERMCRLNLQCIVSVSLAVPPSSHL